MTYLAPIASTIVLWWGSTVALLLLANRPARKHAVIIGVGTCLMLGAMFLVIGLRPDASISAAYLGFGAALVIWGWHELNFLVGYIGGPRKTRCPPRLTMRERFWASTEAIIHHELALAAHALLLVLISVGAENAVAAWVFCTLWVLRLIAKLLIFFGAPNIETSLLPAPIQHLGTYFSRSHQPIPALIAVAITLTAAVWFGVLASGAEPGEFHQTVFLMLTTLVSLALFEILGLVIKIPDQILWSWAARAPSHSEDKS